MLYPYGYLSCCHDSITDPFPSHIDIPCPKHNPRLLRPGIKQLPWYQRAWCGKKKHTQQPMVHVHVHPTRPSSVTNKKNAKTKPSQAVPCQSGQGPAKATPTSQSCFPPSLGEGYPKPPRREIPKTSTSLQKIQTSNSSYPSPAQPSPAQLANPA